MTISDEGIIELRALRNDLADVQNSLFTKPPEQVVKDLKLIAGALRTVCYHLEQVERRLSRLS